MKKISIFLMMLCLACFGVANAQQALPYSYGFENNNLSTDGWTAQITSTSSGINSAAAHTGSYGFRFQYSENPGYLVSPLLTGGGTNGIELSFYYKEYSSSYGDENFQVGYTTDANETDPSNFRYGEIIEASTSWQQHTETLPAGTVRMAIKYLYVDAFYLYLDDFTFEVSNPCSKPTDLAVTTDGQTATVTWDGTASNGFIVNINGTDYTVQTSPYTFNVALSTTYNISVTSNCGSDGLSAPVSTSFTTPDCIGGHTINYTLTDSYGDGWNGASITLIEGCEQTTLTCSGSSASGTLTICTDYFAFVWNTGSYDSECGFTFTEGGTTLFTKPSSLSNGQVLYSFGTTTPIPTGLTAGTPGIDAVDLTWTAGDNETAWQLCVNDDETNLILVEGRPSYTLTRLTPDTDYSVKVRAYIDASLQSCWSAAETFTTAEACAKPSNLAEADITTTSAALSWAGTADSYVLQYRPWQQVGEDKQATAAFVTYTYDLSEFSGQGSIAIRHYDVTDMFYLNVDDVLLTDASGNTIFSEGFESGTIPSTWTNYDVDGDGYTWDLASSSNMSVNGNYGVYSASWTSTTGALTPDNWLIISNVELGGTFSFAAIGQDPNYPAENFAVYVSLESDVTEVPVTGTTYTANNLTPGTPYAWQVKSSCGEYQSNWATSLFKTKDDLLIFATDGDWDVLDNWTDIDGNAATALPTVDNKVRVDADAIVKSGVVATAGKTTIGEGSITIKDGGELKHNSATLWVTMEKGITGYGAGNEDAKDHYYFIATPFSGCTEIEQNGTWSHVNNLASGTYDLYAFDPTSNLEWINYESNSSHSEFMAGNNNGLVFKKGYLYGSEEDRTVTFSGTIAKSVNNAMTETFEYNATSTDDFNGWRLVGNPFSCSTYITYLDGEELQEANFYVMNANGSDYELSESSVSLAPLTGAFINFSASGTVNFSTEVPAGKKTGMINMNLTRGNKTVDQARVRFGQGHNLQHMSFRNSSKLYMPVEGNDYAVVYTENEGEMPVNFKAENDGTYTISFNTENVEFGYLHLIDNMTGNDVDLLSTPSYSFEARTTDYASRFRLVFAAGSANDSFAFYNNGSFVINNEGMATVQVIDINGRILSSESINGCANLNVNVATGVYMLRLINGENVKVQKVIVK
jgi:hypothetical protein